MSDEIWEEIEKWLNQLPPKEDTKEDNLSCKGMERLLEDVYKEAQPIPTEFYSCYSKKPFSACVGCQKYLFVPPQIYEIQKVYKGNQVIFEYAICSECAQSLLQEYSKESIDAIQKYFLENLKYDITSEECCFCKKDKKSLQEYSILSLNKGRKMYSSFVLCSSCSEAMSGLLSEKTQKALSDFTETKFPGIPANFSPVPVFNI